MPFVVRRGEPGFSELPRIVGGRAAAPEECELWAEEPGHTLVIVADDRPVGAVHVSMVGRHEAWLESLRVHPDFQSQGIARQLVAEAEQLVRYSGATIARTAIPSHEYAAQAVAERSGYHPVIHSVVMESPVLLGPLTIPYDAPVSIPTKRRASEVMRMVEGVPAIQAWEDLLPLGWRFRRLAPELITGLIIDHRILLGGDGDAVGLYAVRTQTAVISLLDGTASGVQAVIGTILEREHHANVNRVVVFAPEMRVFGSTSGLSWRAHAWCPDGLTIVEKSLTVSTKV